MRLLKKVLSFALDFFKIYAKMTLAQFLAEIYFPLQMIVLLIFLILVKCGQTVCLKCLKINH